MDLKAEEIWGRLKDPTYYESLPTCKTSFQLEHPCVYVSTKAGYGASLDGFVIK